MANKKIENLDELVFNNLVEYCKEVGIAKLSTRKLASRCGISEFAIFSHYGNKDNLITDSYFKILKKHYDHYCKISNEHKGPSYVYDMMMDYLMNNPLETCFAYGCSVSFTYNKIIEPKYKGNFKQMAENFIIKDKDVSIDKKIIFLDNTINFFLSYSYKFINGIIEYNDNNREYVKELFIAIVNTIY